MAGCDWGVSCFDNDEVDRDNSKGPCCDGVHDHGELSIACGGEDASEDPGDAVEDEEYPDPDEA